MGSLIGDLSLDEMRCPYCGNALSLTDSQLICSGDIPHRFKYEEGVVSFSDLSEFDEHWASQGINSLPAAKIEVANEFLAPLIAELKGGERILDAGCGDGVHALVLFRERVNEKRVKYIGVDASLTAVAATKSRISDGAFLHADITRLPLVENSVDAVFSFGVIAYTNDPSTAIRELARILRPGGLMGLWICPQASGLSGRLLTAVRWTCRVGGKWVTRRIAELIVPLLPILPTRSRVHLGNASWNQCREVVLVNIEPTQLIFPEPDTVCAWIAAAGLDIVLEDRSAPVTIWARKTRG